ncbi:hypothetical protein [Mangrovactinospora gilvigrisea]|uniref:hypothetical protein n=1 Tax=Mangrovactinospora gilvigrisea TaxID=1428644 RepID=UPI000A42F1B7|nr:hypothetical protein [Mangrovactinospora gilvigrisea]
MDERSQAWAKARDIVAAYERFLSENEGLAEGCGSQFALRAFDADRNDFEADALEVLQELIAAGG